MKDLCQRIKSYGKTALGIAVIGGIAASAAACVDTYEVYNNTTIEDLLNTPNAYDNQSVSVKGLPSFFEDRAYAVDRFLITGKSGLVSVKQADQKSEYKRGYEASRGFEAVVGEIRDGDEEPVRVLGHFKAGDGTIYAVFVEVEGSVYPIFK